MKNYILALDEGTTSARAILFDRRAHIVSMAQHEIKQFYPFPSWVEQDPMDIYANQYASLTECIAKSGIDPSEIAAVGITNQRETVIAWNKDTGKPVCNAIVWQCRRTADICRELEAKGCEEYIRATTGLRIDPYFSGTKIKWILDNVSGARELARDGKLMVGTVDTWLIWKLTDGKVFVTDRTNASRTVQRVVVTNDQSESGYGYANIAAGWNIDANSATESTATDDTKYNFISDKLEVVAGTYTFTNSASDTAKVYLKFGELWIDSKTNAQAQTITFKNITADVSTTKTYLGENRWGTNQVAGDSILEIADTAVTVLSPASTNLEETEPILCRCHPWFFRHNPSC